MLSKRETHQTVVLEAARDAIDGPHHILFPKRIHPGDHRGGPRPTRADAYVDTMDYSKKLLHAAWNPKRPIMALAAVHNLYIFRQDIR